MSDQPLQFIIHHHGKYYLTRELWVYDESHGTAAQRDAAAQIAAHFAAAHPKVQAAVVGSGGAPTDAGTAITGAGTAINPPGSGDGTAINPPAPGDGTAIRPDGTAIDPGAE